MQYTRMEYLETEGRVFIQNVHVPAVCGHCQQSRLTEIRKEI